MPNQPPRHVPSRESTRPGAKRGTRGAEAKPAEPAASRPGKPGQAGQTGKPVEPGGWARVASMLAIGAVQRGFAIAATLAVLLYLFASSFSVYLGQQRDIAAAKAELAAHQTEIARLQDELARWQDPAYVRAQARDRLGWVMPGEVGYRVIDANGNIIGGTVTPIEATQPTATQPWYETLWSSLLAADEPAPVAGVEPTGPATIGPDSQETPR